MDRSRVELAGLLTLGTLSRVVVVGLRLPRDTLIVLRLGEECTYVFQLDGRPRHPEKLEHRRPIIVVRADRMHRPGDSRGPAGGFNAGDSGRSEGDCAKTAATCQAQA